MKDWADIPLNRLSLSVRAVTALHNFGYNTLRDVLEHPQKWPNIGLRIIPGVGVVLSTEISGEIGRCVAQYIDGDLW